MRTKAKPPPKAAKPLKVLYQGKPVEATPLEAKKLTNGKIPGELILKLSDGQSLCFSLTINGLYRINNLTDSRGDPIYGFNLSYKVELALA